MIENFYISRYSDKPYHEILIIHELEFIDKSVYERDEITNLEDGGTFIWKSIEELKKEAQNKLGSQFSLKDFHKFFLSTGTAPFSVIEDYLVKWIEEMQNDTI